MPRAAGVTAMLIALALAGCTSDAGSGGVPSVVPGLPGVAAAPSQEEICALLDDATVSAVLDPHDGGGADYAYGGCLWTGTELAGTGVPYTLRIAVLDSDMKDALADDRTAQIDGLGVDATWSWNQRELWFPCAGDKWCLVHSVVTDDEEGSKQAALDIARALQTAVS